MAYPPKSSSRRERDSDPLETLRPLLGLGLLGTILYGAYTIMQRGPGAGGPAWRPPGSLVTATTSEAPAFKPPAVEVPVAAPALNAVACPPPPAFAEALAQVADPPDQVAETASDQPSTSLAAPVDPLSAASSASGPDAAFASAWDEAQDKLAAGRYAEALALLSAWYDDTSLDIEESRRLDDLLGQLAGTVIYSQQDLLLPPHVVSAGETLPSIAARLGVPWQLLAKINGIDDPEKLVPGEQLKVLRGPFDAVVSVARGRMSLRVGGSYAGSFPVVVGRQVQDRIGVSLAVVDMRRGGAGAGAAGPTAEVDPLATTSGKSIVLADGLSIEAVDDPARIADRAPSTSMLVAADDFDEIVDILGSGSHVLVHEAQPAAQVTRSEPAAMLVLPAPALPSERVHDAPAEPAATAVVREPSTDSRAPAAAEQQAEMTLVFPDTAIAPEPSRLTAAETARPVGVGPDGSAEGGLVLVSGSKLRPSVTDEPSTSLEPPVSPEPQLVAAPLKPFEPAVARETPLVAEQSAATTPCVSARPAPTVRNANFVSRVRGWGVVERFAEAVFRPGQDVIVYFELDTLAARRSSDGHTTSVDTTFRLCDSAGRQIGEWDFEPIDDTCPAVRRDYFARYFIRIPEKAAPGSYRLELLVTDLVAGVSSQAHLDLEVRP